MKILMVCLGNICRSPLAQGILQHKIKQAGLNWQVDSAGTSSLHKGEAPHKLSQKIAKLNGVDICAQQSRPFVAEDMIGFDKIYVMDTENYDEVKRISGKHFNAAKVDYLLNATTPGSNNYVPDPWFGGEDGYHRVYKMIDKACERIVNNNM